MELGHHNRCKTSFARLNLSYNTTTFITVILVFNKQSLFPIHLKKIDAKTNNGLNISQ